MEGFHQSSGVSSAKLATVKMTHICGNWNFKCPIYWKKTQEIFVNLWGGNTAIGTIPPSISNHSYTLLGRAEGTPLRKVRKREGAWLLWVGTWVGA